MRNAHYPENMQLFIDGKWIDVDDRDTITITDPSTDQELGKLPIATEEDIQNALDSVDNAFEAWSQTSAWDRESILKRAAELLGERKNHIAHILTLENGKPLADSQGEIDRAIETILWCAEEGKRTYGRILPPRERLLSQSSIKRAIGPVAAFVPWNFPVVLAARKLAAALAAGCTVVLKPAEETPASCIELVRAFIDAGVPSGVVNLLFGIPAQISENLIQSPIIKKVSFTGSVEVGRLLATLAAQQLKPVTMELGGHAPVVIFDDVNADKVAKLCASFKYRNAGQVCLSPSRFYVHESLLEEFTNSFAKYASQIQVGDGLNPDVTMGPLNNSRRLHAAENFVNQAVDAGATVEFGGKRIGKTGNYFEPSVLSNVPPSSTILHEEPFCPIAPIMSFQSFSEILPIVNKDDLGLAAYAFTNNVERAAEFSESVEAGWIGINHFVPALADAPIGGMKNSGLGYEGGPEGLDAYLHSKFISQHNVNY